MNILLTNDDGFDAPGIRILNQALTKAGHDVLLVAPDREKSAVGHGISLNSPMRVKETNLENGRTGYILNGTPADCVKLALFEMCPKTPDLVIAGINPGSNTGVNIDYSGTAAAAREAAFNSIPAFAVSLEVGEKKNMDFIGMSRLVRLLVRRLEDLSLPAGVFLNINCPDMPVDQTRGIRVTTRSAMNVSETFEKRKDPKNREYYWYGRAYQPEGEEGSDTQALHHGYISITPLGSVRAAGTQCFNRLKILEQIDHLAEVQQNALLHVK